MSAEYKGYVLNKNNIIKAPAMKAGFSPDLYHVRRTWSLSIDRVAVFIDYLEAMQPEGLSASEVTVVEQVHTPPLLTPLVPAELSGVRSQAMVLSLT